MDWWLWLRQISQSAAPPGEPFSPQGWYVALSLLVPLFLGVLVAGLLRIMERVCGTRLGGGVL